MKRGGHDVVQSAREKAKRILIEHHPNELPRDTIAELTRILEQFEARSAQ